MTEKKKIKEREGGVKTQQPAAQHNLQAFAYEFKSGLIDQINKLPE